jgi:hypothetical protein
MMPSSLPINVTLKSLSQYLLTTEETIAEKPHFRVQNTTYENYRTENEKPALQLSEFESIKDGHDTNVPENAIP